ncbi:MAG: non-homologous end-joining DNA ligase [Acidimicrobiales bacterium]
MAESRVTVEVDGRTLAIGNLNKHLYPDGTTKAEVIHYLTAVAPVLLPHLAGRAVTMKRYPDGTAAGFFYEKRCPAHAPEWVETVTQWVSHGSGRWGGDDRGPAVREEVPFCVVDGRPTLVWLGGMAALELHTPMAQAAGPFGPDVPTLVVLDLDPGAPATAVECAVVALRIHDLAETLGLQTVVKSSGNKGLQVYVPVNVPTTTAEEAKGFAQAIALLLEKQDPALVVSQQAKALRPGKVLIDWLQNESFKTTVSVYSLRARERPTVSTPLSWDEVAALADGGDPESIHMSPAQVLARIADQGDLFAPAATLEQPLPRFSGAAQ